MSQKAVQSSNFNYTVEATPSFMQLSDGNYVKDGFTINRRTDTLEVLGKVTDRYGLVQNTDLINAAEDAFKAAGMNNYTRKVIVTGSGEKMYAVYDFQTRTKKMAKVGDELGLRLTLKNSFGGELRASFLMGILRLICMNGAVTLDREMGVAKKHGSQIRVDFIVDTLKTVIANWEQSTNIFDRLAEFPVTQEQGHNILNRLESSKVLSTKLREGVGLIWSNPTHREDAARNLYNLYNATTQFLTHNVESERFELSNRVSTNVLTAFERATRDANRFATLVSPLPVAELALN